MFPELGIGLGILVAAVTLGAVVYAMRGSRTRPPGAGTTRQG
jgi:hypothetical protein